MLTGFLFHRFSPNLQVIIVDSTASLCCFFFIEYEVIIFLLDAKSKGYNGEYIQNDDVLLTPKFKCVGRMTISSTSCILNQPNVAFIDNFRKKYI